MALNYIDERRQSAIILRLFEQFNLYSYRIWNFNPHNGAHRAVVGIDVDQALVDAHLPVLVRCGAITARRLPQADLHVRRGERDRTLYGNARFFCNVPDFLANAIYFMNVKRR